MTLRRVAELLAATLTGIVIGMLASHRAALPQTVAEQGLVDFFSFTTWALASNTPSDEVRANAEGLSLSNRDVVLKWSAWRLNYGNWPLHSEADARGDANIAIPAGCDIPAVVTPADRMFRGDEENLQYWVSEVTSSERATIWTLRAGDEERKVAQDVMRARPHLDPRCTVIVLDDRRQRHPRLLLAFISGTGELLGSEEALVPRTAMRWRGVPLVVAAFMLDLVCLPIWTALRLAAPILAFWLT